MNRKYNINKRTYLQLLFLACFCLLVVNTSYGQKNIKVTGVVQDSITNEPIPYALVSVRGIGSGTVTNDNGSFSFSYAPSGPFDIEVSSMGYKPKVVSLQVSNTLNVSVKMIPDNITIDAIEVKAPKEKYRKKGNPAVELAERLIEKKKENDPTNKDYYQYNRYEKIVIAFNNFGERGRNRFLLKTFKFLNNYVDTSDFTGKPILPISVKELSEDVYNRSSPKSTKRAVRAVRREGVDENMGEESNQRILTDIFREIDIYKNDVNLMQKHFLSPLSGIATSFYKYYILDTIMVDGYKCIDLFFAPFNLQSYGFVGHLYIRDDSTDFIQKVDLSAPKDINLNFIKSMKIIQNFKRLDDGTRLIVKDDVMVEFQILPGTNGLYGRRTNTYRNHAFSPPPDLAIFNSEHEVVRDKDADSKPESFWLSSRHYPVTMKEDIIDKLMDEFRNMAVFRFAESFTAIMLAGFIQTGENSKVDIGPVNTFVSNNSVEGWRFRVGAMTTTNFSKHLFAKGYVAYGLRDEKFKYSGELEYSFLKKKEFPQEFPIHSVRVKHNYDIFQPGLKYLYTNQDNFFLSWKRVPDTLMNYMRNTEFNYKREFGMGFSYNVAARYFTQYGSKYLTFTDNITNNKIDHFSLFEAEATLRYAPKEKIYQTRVARFAINREKPVFTLTHSVGIKGVLKSKYNVNRTEFAFQKSQWISTFGYILMGVKAGKVWDKAPYPLLIIPNANLSYTMQEDAYSLMNPLEFVNDQYVSWDLTYFVNGALFNRIPGLKILKLREIITFKGLYGGLSTKNNPAVTQGLFDLPKGSTIMGKSPYMELGVGIDNIIKFIRLDYIWRLNYLDAPGISKHGLRVSAHITF